jgi:hypothetical protein
MSRDGQVASVHQEAVKNMKMYNSVKQSVKTSDCDPIHHQWSWESIKFGVP